MTPIYACARCGAAPRAEDTFICRDCLDSDVRVVEQGTAERIHPGNHKAQRALLIEVYEWFGWNRRLKGA